MFIVHLASEIAHVAKVGGLADVVHGLDDLVVEFEPGPLVPQLFVALKLELTPSSLHLSMPGESLPSSRSWRRFVPSTYSITIQASSSAWSKS